MLHAEWWRKVTDEVYSRFFRKKKNKHIEHQLLVSKETLSSNGSWALDIVTPKSQRSSCFTHSYYRFMKGTGSIICTDDELGRALMGGHTNSLDYLIESSLKKNKKQKTDKKYASATKVGAEKSTPNDGDPDQKREQKNDDWYTHYIGKLRYFSPKEVVNLLGFPYNFEFPSGISLKKQYALAGNSLHVPTVTELLKQFFIEDDTSSIKM